MCDSLSFKDGFGAGRASSSDNPSGGGSSFGAVLVFLSGGTVLGLSSDGAAAFLCGSLGGDAASALFSVFAFPSAPFFGLATERAEDAAAGLADGLGSGGGFGAPRSGDSSLGAESFGLPGLAFALDSPAVLDLGMTTFALHLGQRTVRPANFSEAVRRWPRGHGTRIGMARQRAGTEENGRGASESPETSIVLCRAGAVNRCSGRNIAPRSRSIGRRRPGSLPP